LPGGLHLSFVEKFYAGLKDCSKKYSCPIAGGDTSSAGKIFISVTAFGAVNFGGAILRSGAKQGDDLWLSGFTGESAGGFHCLEKRIDPAGPVKKLIERHLHPEPRLAFSLALASGGLANSMIDVSDGVFIDATHLAERSRALIRIDLGSLLLSPSLADVSVLIGKNPLELALGGGEDYELLFTATKENREMIEKIGENSGVAVSRIGEVEKTGEKGRVRLIDGTGTEVEPPARGFEHFGAP
jgi:thiamine-monophosphate kinase